MNPQENQKVCESSGCHCHCHWVGPVAIVLIGVAVLLQTLGVFSAYVTGIVWPILLIILGATKLCKCCGCCKK